MSSRNTWLVSLLLERTLERMGFEVGSIILKTWLVNFVFVTGFEKRDVIAHLKKIELLLP